MTEAPGTHNPQFLPSDIPAPQDDGGARHLTGTKLPDIALPATDGAAVNLSKLKGRTVVYIYPRTGVPGVDPPTAGTQIPGARGCTPQSCSFRDHLGRTQAARRRAAVRPVDAGHRLSARGGDAAASAVRDPVGREAGADRGAQSADLLHGGHDAAQAHGAGDRRRRDQQSVLSGVPAGQERRGSDRLASGDRDKRGRSLNTARNISGVSTPVFVL